MKNFIRILAFIAILTLLFGCQKVVKEDKKIESTPLYFRLNMSQFDSPTRAVNWVGDLSAPTSGTIPIKNLLIFVHDGSKVLGWKNIDANSTPNLNEVTSGTNKPIMSVPAFASKIFVLANITPNQMVDAIAGNGLDNGNGDNRGKYNSTTPTSSLNGEYVANIKAAKFDIINAVTPMNSTITTNSQGKVVYRNSTNNTLPLYSDDINLNNVTTPSYNWNLGTKTISLSQGAKYATVQVKPALAIVQFNGFTLGGAIESAKFKALYINSFYRRYSLNYLNQTYIPTATDKQNGGSFPFIHIINQGGTTKGQPANWNYDANENNPIFNGKTDHFNVFIPNLGSGVNIPSTNKTYSFNSNECIAFPVVSNSATTVPDALQLVLKFENVRVNGENFYNGRNVYLVVNGFLQGTNRIGVTAGNVYNVNRFTITEKMLYDAPDSEAQIGVYLKVTVIGWTEKTITAEPEAN